VALATIIDFVRTHPGVLDAVTMVLFSDHDLSVYEAALEELSTNLRE
jgi:hypothetical protein